VPRIRSVSVRRILNSHVEFTNEFVIQLTDGSAGTGSASQGETISIYEDNNTGADADPEAFTKQLAADGILGTDTSQRELDEYLQQRFDIIGRNNAFAISLAFFHARIANLPLHEQFGITSTELLAPRLALNVLNGGWHAYTNPVLSDFPEFILVARSNEIAPALAAHASIQRLVRERLASLATTDVAGNKVHCFATRDNRECLDFLNDICAKLGITDQFDLMIDASAGDLWNDGSYQLAITGRGSRSPDELSAYWTDLIQNHGLRFLEDPYHEQDIDSWRALTASQRRCIIVGDNFYSSDAARIEAGARDCRTTGVILKPNQAGTVTGIINAANAAARGNQHRIASHRSISTEELFLPRLTCALGIEYIKIGPLFTDYSSVLRLNEILRFTTPVA
jgi:enolase